MMKRTLSILMVAIGFFAASILVVADNEPLIPVKPDKIDTPNNQMSLYDKFLIEAFVLPGQRIRWAEWFKDVRAAFDKDGSLKIEQLAVEFGNCVKKHKDLEPGIEQCTKKFLQKEYLDDVGEAIAVGKLAKGYLELADQKGEKAAIEKILEDSLQGVLSVDTRSQGELFIAQAEDLMKQAIAKVAAELKGLPSSPPTPVP